MKEDFRLAEYLTELYRLHFWIVEQYWPATDKWIKCSRLYVTRWGAQRALRRFQSGR